MAPVLGTSSAPVSRQNSLNGGGDAQDLSIMPNNAISIQGPEISPASSDRTAAETANNTAANAGGRETRFNLDLPPTSSRNLGSASAPTSPRIIQHESHASPLFRSDTEKPMPLSTSQSRPEASRMTTSGTAGTVGTVGTDGVRRRDHQHRHHHNHHHSGHNTPAFDPYRGNSPYSWEHRPMNHQNSRHATPLFSLARPLPTHEQRTAQKAYRNQVRESAGMAGPGAHHHQQHPHHAAVEHPALLGPGAIHHGGVVSGNQMSRGPSYLGGAGHNDLQNEQMMAMLRQLLNQTQGDNVVKKEQAEDDVRDADGAVDEKGAGKTAAAAKNQQRTSAAERRSSFGSQSSCSSSLSSSDDADTDFPNPWARFRHSMREPFAEFLGTMLLIFFGTGVSLQVFLSSDPDVVSSPRGSYLSISFGWGIGVAMGVWVAGGISGGHINPAVTFSLAVFRGFPWKKVPGYVLAQILGSMTAAGVNYGLYRRAISIYEGGPNIRTVNGATATASLFSTYPLEYVSNANAFFQEFVDSTILLMVVLAISDSNNASPPDGLNPLVLFLLITGIGAALGMQTAYCINPARDLGPRLVTWFAGYGREVWNFRNQYWVWTPVLATMSGALFGSFLYDLFIYTGSESPLNRKWQFPWQKKKRPEFGPGSKAKMPAGQI